MGKRKIEIKRIDNRDKRYVTFSKRRTGLFKKAADACKLYDSEIAIIVFSPVGKLYTFGHSSVDSVVDRFLTNNKLNDNQQQQQQEQPSSLTRTIKDPFLINNKLNEQQQQQQQQQQQERCSLMRTIKEEKDDDQVVLNHMVIKKEEDLHHHKKKMKVVDEAITRTTNLYLRDGDGYSWPSQEDWNSINFDPNFIHRSS